MKKFIFGVLFSASLSVSAQENSLYVIGNNSGVPAQISFSQLKSVFMGAQSNWGNGDKVIIALLKLNTPAGKNICDRLYGMSADQVTKHLLSISIKGTVEAPVFFNTAAELRNFISATKGAIGVTSEPAAGNNAKAVSVDGKRSF
ncbi:MAG: hypothetical protein ACO25B_10580 [Chitinophagaceae bacterium]